MAGKTSAYIHAYLNFQLLSNCQQNSFSVTITCFMPLNFEKCGTSIINKELQVPFTKYVVILGENRRQTQSPKTITISMEITIG